MGDGGVAVERATTPADAIGRALLRPWWRWVQRPLRRHASVIGLMAAGIGLCAALAALFAYGSARDALALVLSFLAGVSLAGIAFAIGAHRRRRTQAELRRANAEMTSSVQQRTQALDEARQALLQSQKMEALGRLTGGIAHDVNNALTAITSALEVAREAAVDARQRERLDRALEAARQGGLSVQQMLMFARNEPLHLRPVDLNPLLEATVAMFRRNCPETIALALQPGPEPQWAMADPTQVRTALLNLAVNARDAMPAGGRITIGTRQEQRNGAAFACIVVADTGAGMSAEAQARVFEPCFSARMRGAGLGLGMVRGAMRQMGGDVTLVSQPGKGTIARLWLPAANDAPGEAAASPGEAVALPGEAVAGVEAPPPALPATGVELVYVEDDPLVSATTAELLQARGFVVHSAADSAQALRLLEAHPEVRAVLIDIGLPGMSGHQLATVARRTRPELKVLFLSGRERRAGQSAPEDANTGHVGKPYRQQDLVTALRRLLAPAVASEG